MSQQSPDPTPEDQNPGPDTHLILIEELRQNVAFAQFGGVSLADLYDRNDLIERLLALKVPETAIDAAMELGEWEGTWILEHEVLVQLPET